MSCTKRPLIARRYIASPVNVTPPGRRRSTPNDAVKFCGFLKLGSVTFTTLVPKAPGDGAGWPRQLFGNSAGSVTYAGVAGPLHGRLTPPMPVLLKALLTKMNGTGDVKTPTLPRTCVTLFPPTFQ